MHRHFKNKRHNKIYLALVLASIVAAALLYCVHTRTMRTKQSIHTDITGHSIPSTQDWHTYHDKQYSITFSYPKAWEVAQTTYDSNHTLILRAKNSLQTNIRMYINNQGFYGFEGLPQKERSWKTGHMVMIDESLVGIEHKGLYITFEAQPVKEITDIMGALVQTLEFQ